MKSARLARKKPQQQRSQAMVDAILDAAAKAFSTAGFAETTTNTIAERAGVSIGSFYQYFPNKLSLLEALRERHVQGLWEKIGAACNDVSTLSLRDSFRHIISQCSAYNAPHVALLATIHRELPILPHGTERMTVAELTLREKMKALLEAHKTSIKVSIDQALFIIPALGRGIFTSAVVEQPEVVKTEQLVDDVVSAIIGYLT